MSLDFVRRMFRIGDDAGESHVLQLFTPNIVDPGRPGLRLFVGGLTLVGLGCASLVAISSLLTLIGALFGIYLLLTQVLGLKLDVDPRAFVEEAQRYAAGRN
jgi:hypothetical protein